MIKIVLYMMVAMAFFIGCGGTEAKDKPDTASVPSAAAAQKFAKSPPDVNSKPGSIPMVFVKGGTFMMGCTAEQESEDCSNNERPAHKVTLSDFYIMKYPMTRGLWKAVTDSYNYPGNFSGGDNFPVDYSSWYEVQEFIKKLNAKTGKTYRLPTEAEWEYAARGGSKSNGYKYSGSDNIDDVAWHKGNSVKSNKEYTSNTIHAVGTKQPNELGIYDMSGNVDEWVYDLHGDYASGAQTDPVGTSQYTSRVQRGGGCLDNPWNCRVSSRSSLDPERKNFTSGFRLVISPIALKEDIKPKSSKDSKYTGIDSLLFGLLGETKDDTVARPPASPPKDADFNSWLSGLSDSSKKGAPEKDTVKQAATPPIPEKNTVKEAAPVKMENVNGVHFTYDTWHSYPAHIIVIKTAAGALAKYNTRTREAGISQLEAKLSVKEWQNFVGKLDRCGIGAWEKRYSVSGLVLDGSSWSLELTFPNNNSLRYSGRNAEPPDWNKLKELMDEMAIMAGGGKVSGSRGLTSIWRALSRNTARPLREAYVKRVEEKPDLSGTVTVKFAINGLGKVTYARIAESTVNDTALENAVVTIVKGFVFDMMIDNIGDVTEVTYPVRFLAEPLVNLDSIDMVFVKGGTLAMGCTPEQGVCKGEEKPAHKATVGDFYIGRREVSQALWKTVMGSNPSRHYGDDNLPVENVSWNDVQEFIKKLNAKTGKKYRLPTEAEWEYAARGGNKSKGYKYSGSNNLNDVTGPTYTETSSTDTRQPNELGIYDMSGNVEEYTGDIVRGGDYRIYRGGHMYSKDGVSYRAFIFPDRSGGGFRLARDP